MKVRILLTLICCTNLAIAKDFSHNEQVIVRLSKQNLNNSNPLLNKNVAMFDKQNINSSLLLEQFWSKNNLNLNLQERINYSANRRFFDTKNNFHTDYGVMIDEAYLQFNNKKLEFSVGRKKFSKQFSYFESALNILSRHENQTIDYFDKKIEVSGQDGLFAFYLNDDFSLTTGIIPKFQLTNKYINSYKDSYNNERIDKAQYDDGIKDTVFVELSKNFDQLDLDLSVLYKHEKVIQKNQNTFALGLNKTVNDNLITYIEGNVSKTQEEKSANKIIIGANLTFSNNINLIMEFFRQNNGLNKAEFNTLTENVENSYNRFAYLDTFYYDGTARKLRKNYLQSRISKDINNNTLYVNLIKTIDDSSTTAIFGFDKKFDNLQIGLFANTFNNNKNSENYYLPYERSINFQAKWNF